jgi:hypothetical protein
LLEIDFQQMWTSAHRSWTLAVSMKIVSTLRAGTGVNAGLVSLVPLETAQVYQLKPSFIVISSLLSSPPDIDECAMTEPPCPENTLCVNTLGGYDCSTCLDGFSPDDGGQCTGMHDHVTFSPQRKLIQSQPTSIPKRDLV